MKKVVTIVAALAMALMLAACSQQAGTSQQTGSSQQSASLQQERSQSSATASDQGLYFTKQEVRPSPEWVTKLDVAKDANQFIVVAGVDKSTAYITMHQKAKDGTWQQIIATPGFIGLEGLGDADKDHAITPVGTFTIDKAFGLAVDPGCKMDYTQVDDSYYWSGDGREGMHFNELVSIKDLPNLDTEESERIADFDYAYQYVLNMGYNSECIYEEGSAFFFHSFRVNRPYTGGCVAVPEDIMKFVMQHVEPGCKITIDSLEHFGGDLDA